MKWLGQGETLNTKRRVKESPPAHTTFWGTKVARGALLFCLICSGCMHTDVYEQETRFHKDGRAKPMVTLVPVFDRSEAPVGWSLSEEFTDHMRQRLLKTHRFYLNTPEELNAMIASLTPANDPFAEKPEWIGTTFTGQEFVVFAEIVDHFVEPKPESQRFFDKLGPSHELTLTLRLRIFDIRKKTPQIILEELISRQYSMPELKNLEEKGSQYWQKSTFALSPLGLAHMQMAKEVSKRAEEYILLAQSR